MRQRAWQAGWSVRASNTVEELWVSVHWGRLGAAL